MAGFTFHLRVVAIYILAVTVQVVVTQTCGSSSLTELRAKNGSVMCATAPEPNATVTGNRIQECLVSCVRFDGKCGGGFNFKPDQAVCDLFAVKPNKFQDIEDCEYFPVNGEDNVFDETVYSRRNGSPSRKIDVTGMTEPPGESTVANAMATSTSSDSGLTSLTAPPEETTTGAVAETPTTNDVATSTSSTAATTGSSEPSEKTTTEGEPTTTNDMTTSTSSASDDCATSGGCSPHATCTESAGNYNCTCMEGFTGDGINCADVDECAVDNGGCCILTSNCTNTIGSYYCTCLEGYTGDGFNCVSVTPPIEGDLRLVGGHCPTYGRLEIYHNAAWGTVCDDNFHDEDAAVACRQLGFSRGLDAGTYAGPGTGDIWMTMLACVGSENLLTDCSHDGWGATSGCDHSEDSSIICFDTHSPITGIRLAGGTAHAGRLEIQVVGVWGTVCRQLFTDNSAAVACKMLGYSGATAVNLVTQYGPGTGVNWLTMVECTGTEIDITDCDRFPFSMVGFCDHSDDVSIDCQP